MFVLIACRVDDGMSLTEVIGTFFADSKSMLGESSYASLWDFWGRMAYELEYSSLSHIEYSNNFNV